MVGECWVCKKVAVARAFKPPLFAPPPVAGSVGFAYGGSTAYAGGSTAAVVQGSVGFAYGGSGAYGAGSNTAVIGSSGSSHGTSTAHGTGSTAAVTRPAAGSSHGTGAAHGTGVAVGEEWDGVGVPPYMVPFADEQFGNTVIRVTDPLHAVPGLGLTWENPAIHHYSVDQAWNADGTLLRLDRGTNGYKVFLDGNTYEPLYYRELPGDVRWHHTDPNKMVVMFNGGGVGYWNPTTNVETVVDSLAAYNELSFQNKGNISDDNNWIACTGTRKSDGKLVSFGYNLATETKYPDIDQSGWSDIRWVTISPLGTYVVTYNAPIGSTEAWRLVYNRATGALVQQWTEYERPGHCDFIVDPDTGYEVAIGRSKKAPDQWMMIKRRLSNGAVTVISRPCYASHTTARNLDKTGWAFATYVQGSLKAGWEPYQNVIGAFKTDGSSYRWLVTHNSASNGYYTEPHGSPSPDGRKLIFETNWNDPNGPVASYVAEYLVPLA